jgi:hypothetical protein
MANSQAIVLICSDMKPSKGFKKFLDTNLNLYSFQEIQKEKMLDVIMSQSLKREELFAEMEEVFNREGTGRVIIFGHQPCQYISSEQNQSRHETFLRHAVSVIRAKFSDKEISAYLARTENDENVAFNQVI